jgi:predicted transcriptional regulator
MSRRIHIHLDDEIVLKVEALALQQDRSISNMIRVLLKEALADRKIPIWYQNKDGTLTAKAEKFLSKAERLLEETGTE